jgi:hypothetical protein
MESSYGRPRQPEISGGRRIVNRHVYIGAISLRTGLFVEKSIFPIATVEGFYEKLGGGFIAVTLFG